MFRWQGAGGQGHLGEILEKAGLDLDITTGNVSVQVECDEGEGTVTVTHDGETETHEFDCTDMGDHHVMMLGKGGAGCCMGGAKMFGMPHLRGAAPHAKSFTIELDGEGDEGNAFAQVIRLHSQPKTSFNVTSNGEITVTVQKGENELVLTFKNADDLAESRPELAEQYHQHEPLSESSTVLPGQLSISLAVHASVSALATQSPRAMHSTSARIAADL